MKWHVPCLRGVIGDWVYYSGLMNSHQITDYVLTSKDIREAKALEDHLQRNLKPRVKKIVTYLQKRVDRFFNSIVLGVFGGLPNWIELDLSRLGETLSINNLREIEESLGILVFTGTEKMFAIDGQHRVEGIRLAFSEVPKRLDSDQFSVLFVAHVDDSRGKVRTRRLFCDINKNAVPVSAGDKVIIDEDDLSAIVARRLYAEYPYFQEGKLVAVTERKEVLVQDGVECFTSLLALHTVNRILRRVFKKERDTPDTHPDNVSEFAEIVRRFYDFIIEHERTLNNYFKQGKTSLKDERRNNRSLFFRPVGLEILARLYVHFLTKDRLARLEYGLKTLKFNNPGGIFDGILWNNGRVEARAKEKSAAFELFLYLLNEMTDSQPLTLQIKLREVKKSQAYTLPPPVKMPTDLG